MLASCCPHQPVKRIVRIVADAVNDRLIGHDGLVNPVADAGDVADRIVGIGERLQGIGVPCPP